MTIYQNQFAGDPEDQLAYAKEVHAKLQDARKLEILKATPTRELLKMRKQCYATGHVYLQGDYDYHDPATAITADLDDLKTELATREHVPNRREGKELRRKKARIGRSWR